MINYLSYKHSSLSTKHHRFTSNILFYFLPYQRQIPSAVTKTQIKPLTKKKRAFTQRLSPSSTQIYAVQIIIQDRGSMMMMMMVLKVIKKANKNKCNVRLMGHGSTHSLMTYHLLLCYAFHLKMYTR